MQIKYLDGDVVTLTPDGDVHVMTVNGKLYTTIDNDFVEGIVLYLKQAKPWIRDNGDGTHTIEYPDAQVEREIRIHNQHNRGAGGFSGD